MTVNIEVRRPTLESVQTIGSSELDDEIQPSVTISAMNRLIRGYVEI